MNYNYDTLSEAINDLIKRGYNEDFNLNETCIECKTISIQLTPSEFKIDEFHRFEGDSNPADNSILYAISSLDEAVKGTLVDAYGVYSDSLSEEMIQKLKVG